jgi:RHS repeat-associated protein
MRCRHTIGNVKFLGGLVLLLVLLLRTGTAFGAEEPYVNSIRGTGVTAGARFDVTDEKFLSSGIFYGTIKPGPYSLLPENIVELKLNYDTSAYFYDKIFTATVNVTILCYNNAFDTSQVFTQYNNINLTIKHDSTTANPYKGVYFMKFSGAYKFRVIINSITCPELGASMPPVLIVEGKTVIKRKYNFSGSSSDVTKIEELPGQIRLSWVPASYAGAESFDLEYTVVDDSSTAAISIRNYLATSTPIPPVFMDDLFRNNATRVNTSASSYTLNPLYRAGYLLFRIRGVQFGNEYQTFLTVAEQSLRSEGSWNYQASKLNQPSYQYNVVQLQWHEPNLNWQYTANFSEEGKHKEMIGYFDGILKNRQNVTLNNSEKRTLVKETVYDALGRAAINVLPAPTQDSTIHYFVNFNQDKLGKGYSYRNFSFGASCRTIPDTMSRLTGAHRYYSPNNNINDYFFKKYIPQAEGYPFSVTEYTPDNTSRIAAQSAVGKDFQPGSNHETKYFYSKPTQEELDRLFGSEAGNASHHHKNMVVDPNGQISVSYLNSSGKNIATAFAGLTPNNVESLSSNNGTGVDVTKNMLTSQDFTRDYGANTLLGNSSFLAAISGNYKFTYNLTPLRLDVLHGANNQFKICNTCYYDLLITVKDNCSQVLRTVSKPLDPNTVFQTDCNITPAPITDTFSVDIFNVGEYSVSYLLKISERAFNYYDSVHLVQNTNIRTFNSFVLEKLSNADFKGCFSECSTCLAELGTKIDFVNNKIKPLFIQADSMVYTPAEFDTWANLLYDSLLANCNSIQAGCNTGSPCDEEKQMLLDDVRPGGQYSLFDENFFPLDPFINIVYNHRNDVTYYNEDGTIGMIEYNGQLIPANTWGIPLKLFIENFQDSWAEALLPYHPEYCFYQWCLYGTNSNSKAFDNEITDIEDDAVATSKGYFNSSVSALLNNDPFFSFSGSGYPYYSQMLDSLNLFSRTIPGYNGPDFTIKQYIDFELYCEETPTQPGSCSFPAPGAACRSPYMEWLLYRDYYLNLKAYFNEKARLANPSFANCRNCFIGTDYTEFYTCVAPAPSDFTIQLDPTYTSGKRIIVKYKNGESAVTHNIKLTISYNFGSFIQQFRAGRSTELYIVPASVNDFYAISIVQCDTAAGGGGSRVMSSKGGAQQFNANTKVKFNVRNVAEASSVPGCPCPDPGMFTVQLTGGQCGFNSCEFIVYYNGDPIPPNRWVYVDVYWYDYNWGTSGISTVVFSSGQTVGYGCTGMGQARQQNQSPTAKKLKLSSVKGPVLLINVPKQPTPQALKNVQVFKDSMKAAQSAKSQGVDQNIVLPPPEGSCDFIYLYVQNVYCYDAPGFYCPGDNTEPSSLCKDDPMYPYYMNKVRRYEGYQNSQAFYQGMMANYGNLQNQAQSSYNSNCQANCEAMADAWINSLRKCTPNESTLASIKAGLIAVCQSSCDNSHPYGASTNPSLTQSFESVIRSYIPASSDSCTGELLSDPYPFNRQPQLENTVLIKIDNCLTTRFSQMKTLYLGSGLTGTMTFHQWLQKQLKNDYVLTAQELTDLEASINASCKYLKKPLLLPVVFNCSNTAPCLDSATTVQTYAAFLVKYPGMTISNPYYEILLTNYYNHTFGFNLNYEDYQGYIEKCQTGTTNKDLLCNKASGSQITVKEDVMQCMADVFNLAIAQAVNEYKVYIDSVRTAFRNAYMGKCMNVAPGLTMNAKLFEYHYTLYYYDQAGNLVKTIPPEGVKLLSDVEVAQVASNRLNTNTYCYSNSPELIFNANIMTMNRELSYDPVIDGKYTLETWVKFGNLNVTGPNGIFSYNDIISSPTEAGFALLHRNSKLAFVVGTSPKLQVETPLLSTFLSANIWYHVVVTVNNASNKPVKMFINGNNVPLTYLNSNPATFAIFSWYTHKLRIGAAFDNNTLTAVANTGIKHFRWYQRELPASEIQQNAYNNCFTAASESGLISYVPVNEGVGNVIEDKLNGNLSTISGNGTAVWSNYVAGVYPKHRLPTSNWYNSYNQLVRQITPDGGIASFWYDILGRKVASQNSEQKLPKNTANSSANRYSYTRYDAIGRVYETGEKYSGGMLIFEDEGGSYESKSVSSLAVWYNVGTDKQVTTTIYDQPNTSVVTNTTITNQQTVNSRKRVVASIYKELKTNSYYDFATHYVYDISGNIKTLYQDLKPMRDVELVINGTSGLRRLDYDYDLISNKINRVYYQKGFGDQFIYRYDYDADNRITEAYSSRNGLQWQRDAKYYYYLHGLLARTELGKYQVQGVDYAYTLQGWMKGINSQSLDVNKDMGGDGNQSSPTFQKFGRDVYGFSLGYHSNDYKPIGALTATAFDVSFTSPPGAVAATGNTGSQLFNGNISNTTVALNMINNGQTAGYSYLYDQLNRLLGTRQHTISGTSWSYNTSNTAYEEKTVYDANGNIKTYVRKGANTGPMPLAMDNLKYFYYYTNTSNVRSEYDPTQPLPVDVKTLTNQLAHVDDSDPSGNYPTDIDDQGTTNYDYDNIGNLIKDNAEGITSMNWTVYGKLKQVVKSNGITINYGYDAAGKRVVKEVIGAPGGYNRQFYIKDLQGNTIAIYKDQSDYVDWMEQHLYGSSRLGAWKYGKATPGTPGSVVNDTMMVGSVNYDLPNHLGNVLVTISDKKIGVSGNGTTNDYYKANVIAANDYYPFGLDMPGRNYGQSGRFGFNGKERDNDIQSLAVYDYGFRIYNPAIGRFLSVDPLAESYPWYTPYQFAGNKPIWAVDLDGAEELDFKKFGEGMVLGSTHFINARWPTAIPGEENKKKFKLDLKSGDNNQFFTTNGNEYRLKEGKTPSQGLTDMFNNPGEYALDCQFFVQVTKLHGMMYSMGPEKFDEYIKTNYRSFKIEGAFSTGIEEKDFLYPGTTEGTVMGKDAVEVNGWDYIDKANVGTEIALKSSFLGKDNDFYIENIVKTGKDKYLAQGLGGTKELTLAQVKKALSDVKNDNKDHSSEVTISEIRVSSETDTNK